MAQPNTKYNAEVDALLKQMTLEEKIGQMTQLTFGIFSDNSQPKFNIRKDDLKKAIVQFNVGSILNNAQDHAQTMEEWHQMINTIQDYATKETRLKIPVLYGVDAIHGATYITNSTLFPQQIGVGCSRNTLYASEMGRLTAMSTRATGVRWNFAPVLEVGRSPLWSRFPETFGESTQLAQEMGVANITGTQGKSVADITAVAACMKHFIGYSGTNSGKDRTNAYIPETILRDVYLPPFRSAVNAGAKTVMINSGDINGIPVHANKKILTDLLRKELGFEGLAVTDWEDITKLVNRHR
ncbi:MAG: glycoside hydrolase family 3 protein, partial [Flexibacteraceae bacterium]